VIVGSVNGGPSIFRLLEALARQIGDVAFEVVIADRCSDGTAERIAKEWPEAILIRAARDTPLPELRTLALERSEGQIVFVTEDHTVPPVNWIDRLATALGNLPPEVAAVGGPVDNAECHSTIDWAVFLCEYHGFLPNRPAGEVDEVPGMNVAYRREALVRSRRDDLSRGFWESTVHPRLRAEGRCFQMLSDAVIDHRKSFSFGYAMRQRFQYSRHYAASRFRRAQWLRRGVYALLAFALPPALLLRISTSVWPRRSYRRAFVRALPAIAALTLAWALGEVTGYLLGPGDSLSEIE